MSDSENRSPPEEPHSEEPIVVFRTWNDFEANLIAGLLQGVGIHSNLVSDVPHSVYPLTVDGLGEVRVMVAKEDEAEALACIAGRAEPESEATRSAPDGGSGTPTGSGGSSGSSGE